MKQYGPSFISSSFPYKANKIPHIARHVAIKNRVLRLSHMSLISVDRAQQYIDDMCAHSPELFNSVVDIALL